MEKNLKMVVIPTSTNRKTGDIIQSYTSRTTCPISCPFRQNGCYADSYYTNRVWKRCDQPTDPRYISNQSELTQALIEAVAVHAREEKEVLFRHNVAGDLSIPGTNDIDMDRLVTLIRSFNDVKDIAKKLNVKFIPFSYTHCKLSEQNTQALYMAQGNKFTINVSCETIKEVADAHKKLLPSVITSMCPEQTIKELQALNIPCVQCPSQTNNNTTCKKCKLCTKNRDVVVVFAVHGTSQKKAKRAIAEKVENA